MQNYLATGNLSNLSFLAGAEQLILMTILNNNILFQLINHLKLVKNYPVYVVSFRTGTEAEWSLHNN